VTRPGIAEAPGFRANGTRCRNEPRGSADAVPFRPRRVAALLSIILFIAAGEIQAASRSRAVSVPPGREALRPPILQIVNRVLDVYADADFQVAWKAMDDDPDAAVNALWIAIPISRAGALIVKYESGTRDPQLIVRALEHLEFALDRRGQWEGGWVSASVVNMLDLSIHRLRGLPDLPPDVVNRVEIAWGRALDLTRAEADLRLVWNMPVPPYDSSGSGDTQAEEFAWEASLLTAAAVFLPDHPNRELWERKARQLAYNAITRPSDPPDLEGIKVTTVAEDFRLDNHDIPGNPYYAIATLQLLQQAELPYRMSGRDAPGELHHNFIDLYRVYETYVGENAAGQLVWNRLSDPGDPSLIPVGKTGRSSFHLRLARQQAANPSLWRAPSVTSGVIPADELHTAVQNHKVAWYYIVGLYWWYWPVPGA
jgi:hypothetical protein